MVMASTKFTEGNGFPMEIAEPSSLKLASPRATAVPGSTDPFSTGIFGLIDAQPITTIAREQINRILWLLAIIGALLFCLLKAFLLETAAPLKNIVLLPREESLLCHSGLEMILKNLWRFSNLYFYYKIIGNRYKPNFLLPNSCRLVAGRGIPSGTKSGLFFKIGGRMDRVRVEEAAG
jgi:hypothetical protein